MRISRRNMIKGLVGSAIAGAVVGGLKLEDYVERKTSYRSIKEISGFLEGRRLNSEIASSQSNRSLLIVGDVHLGFGDTYFDFFKNFSREFVDVDRIFMEGAYDHFVLPDPFYAAMEHSANLQGDNLEGDFKENDTQGYYRLSEEFEVSGIEDKELYHDSLVLAKLYRSILNFHQFKYYGVEEKYVAEAREWYSLLNNQDFELGDFNRFSRDKLRSFEEFLEGKLHKKMILERNDHVVSVIDENLRAYEVGALIIGKGHKQNRKGPLINGRVVEYNLLKDFASYGINTCYIDVGKAAKFNETFEG